jgi:hypothetical protein
VLALRIAHPRPDVADGLLRSGLNQSVPFGPGIKGHQALEKVVVQFFGVDPIVVIGRLDIFRVGRVSRQVVCHVVLLPYAVSNAEVG